MKKILFIALLLLGSLQTFAQQNLFAAQDIESPTVDAKGRVTFRFIAPNATKVEVAGDFVDIAAKNPVGGLVGTGLVECKKDKDGVWTYTSKPLKSELYSYVFVVDGVPMTDPNNVYVYRTVHHELKSITVQFIRHITKRRIFFGGCPRKQCPCRT